jgi:glycosyltransferase involved in cell wall biosynthesis
MTLPTVSVVMPVRNAARTLPSAIESIRAQTFQDWELLAIDDGSTDATRGILRQFASMDARMRHAPATDRGLVHALNQGLQMSRSALVARMDADDFAHPDRLTLQVARLKADAAVGLVGSRVRFGGDRDRAEGYALHVDWLNTLITSKAITLNRFVESPLAHPSVTFRRSLIDRYGGYANGPFPEDYELWLRWLDAGVSMASLTETLLTWNDLPARLSRTDPRYDTEAFFKIKARYLAREIHRSLGRRTLWIWGAGRPTRKRAEWLCEHDLEISGYIDIDPSKAGRPVQGRPVIEPAHLPAHTEAMVIGYVANRGARALIRSTLTTRGYAEGRDFWMAA